MRFSSLSLSAQTAYAELFSQAQTFEMTNALAGLVGAFHKRELKGRDYWYFGYRDIDRKLRMRSRRSCSTSSPRLSTRCGPKAHR